MGKRRSAKSFTSTPAAALANMVPETPYTRAGRRLVRECAAGDIVGTRERPLYMFFDAPVVTPHGTLVAHVITFDAPGSTPFDSSHGSTPAGADEYVRREWLYGANPSPSGHLATVHIC